MKGLSIGCSCTAYSSSQIAKLKSQRRKVEDRDNMLGSAQSWASTQKMQLACPVAYLLRKLLTQYHYLPTYLHTQKVE